MAGPGSERLSPRETLVRGGRRAAGREERSQRRTGMGGRGDADDGRGSQAPLQPARRGSQARDLSAPAHYIALFKRVKANAAPCVVPPVATTDSVHFDRAAQP